MSRNVTWTLQYPEKVYASFKRVLKPGGTLLIYDANWHAHLYDPELMKKVRAREETHFRKYGTREIVTEDNPEFLATCPMTRYQLPEWDEGVLTELGFKEIPHNTAAHLAVSRFTASKPSKSAIASVEKFTRQLTTLIARYFLKVEIQRDIGRFVYGDWEKALYAESPLFEICARKVK